MKKKNFEKKEGVPTARRAPPSPRAKVAMVAKAKLYVLRFPWKPLGGVLHHVLKYVVMQNPPYTYY